MHCHLNHFHPCVLVPSFTTFKTSSINTHKNLTALDFMLCLSVSAGNQVAHLVIVNDICLLQCCSASHRIAVDKLGKKLLAE